MSLLAKPSKVYLETAQFSLGIVGGIFYYLIYLLSLWITPLQRLIKVYREGTPIYSTLLMTLISMLIMILAIFTFTMLSDFFPKPEFSLKAFKDIVIEFFFMSLMISPWIFLSLDLFAYYKRFRSDRKNNK